MGQAKKAYREPNFLISVKRTGARLEMPMYLVESKVLSSKSPSNAYEDPISVTLFVNGVEIQAV